MKGRVGTILLFVTIVMVRSRTKARPATHATAHAHATTTTRRLDGLRPYRPCHCLNLPLQRKPWRSTYIQTIIATKSGIRMRISSFDSSSVAIPLKQARRLSLLCLGNLPKTAFSENIAAEQLVEA
jgi:hypothetical protein